jgi:hypothetical protein
MRKRKFRHWLVKKLGGHVSTPIAPKIEYYYERPIALFAEIEVDDRLLNQDPIGMDNKIRQRLAERISNALFEKQLLDIVVTDDPYWCQKIYKARVRVYTPKGADNEQRETD